MNCRYYGIPAYIGDNKELKDKIAQIEIEMTKEEEIIEIMAEVEHIRGAKWQNYLHSYLTWNNDIQAWVLPHEWKDRWQMQINTPYQMLSEKEKDSDRREAKVTLKALEKEGFEII